jgi:hypothetical protein
MTEKVFLQQLFLLQLDMRQRAFNDVNHAHIMRDMWARRLAGLCIERTKTQDTEVSLNTEAMEDIRKILDA